MQVTTTISNHELQMLLVEALKKDFSLLKDAVRMVLVENPNLIAEAIAELRELQKNLPITEEFLIDKNLDNQ